MKKTFLLILFLVLCFFISVKGVPTIGTFTPISPNQSPVQSNHLIWDGITEKSLNATDVNVSSVSINFTINEPDGDPMDWYIYYNNSGTWGLVDFGTGTSNGTKISTNVSWFRPVTNYSISFNVTDNMNWTNETYWFVTDYSAPQFSNENPSNGSIIRVSSCDWNIAITDLVAFNWTIDCSNGQNSSDNNSGNGTFYLNLTNLVIYTTYIIWVNATNGNLTTRDLYIFTVMPRSTSGTSGGGGSYVPPIEEEIVEGPLLIDESTMFLTWLGLILFSITFIIFLLIKRKERKKNERT